MAYGSSIWRMAAIGFMILALPIGAHAEGLAGVWKGPWYLGMSSGVAVMRLGDGEATLQMTNNETFGADPVTLTDVSYEAKVLRFRAKGTDGNVMTGAVPVRDDGAIRGAVTYGGYKLRLELSRLKSD